MTKLISDIAHYELMNWSRWCWLGESPIPTPKRHCRSIEHRYVAPWPDDLHDDPLSRAPVFLSSALKVNEVFTTATKNERWVMIAEYPGYKRFQKRLNKRAQRLGLNQSSYEMILVSIGKKVDEATA